MRALWLAALGALTLVAACTPPAPQASAPVDLALQTRAVSSAALFGPPRPYSVARGNDQIARDILDLGFRLESGRELPRFTRFEGPVALTLRGPVPPLGAVETDRLIARLRSEARLDIRRVTSDDAEIIVEFVPRAQLRRAVPDAACFVVPNMASWDAFRANPRSPELDWTALTTRTRALVIVPADVTVQEMRDCLHEEIAQALGPLNDLYRIGETVWNDDNFQTTLTGYDMLVLRVWNSPALRSGMTREDVAQRLPAILRQLNPRGGRAAIAAPDVTPQEWVAAIEAALSTPSRRGSYAAARRALDLAVAQGWQDERLAFSLFLAARFAPADEGAQALEALALAGRIYATRPGTAAQRAHIDLHMAAQALANGQHAIALRLTDRAMVAARRTENGALLASLMLVRAQALDRLERRAEADTQRRAAIPFAIFGFGSDTAARTRQTEIAALGARNQNGN
jgi:hypothetical protein